MIIACRTISAISAYATFGINESGNYAGRKVSSQPALANLSIDGASSWHFVNARWNPFAEEEANPAVRDLDLTFPKVCARGERDEAGVFLERGGGVGEEEGVRRRVRDARLERRRIIRAKDIYKCRRYPRHQMGEEGRGKGDWDE